MEENFKGSRQLIVAILVQAFNDTFSYRRIDDTEGALRFIDKRNPLFVAYCELINVEPDIIAKRMQYYIKNGIKKFNTSD